MNDRNRRLLRRGRRPDREDCGGPLGRYRRSRTNNEDKGGRKNPGLSPQHVTSILALAKVANARIEGARPRSPEITFRPGEIKGGRHEIDIGTAGSITLLLECLLPALVFADSPSTLAVRGGTDVKWSPTIDYLSHVALLAFAEFGVQSRLSCIRRGYYPQGGGIVILEVVPGKLKRADLSVPEPNAVEGSSHSSNLPEHVARRQAKAAVEILERSGFDAEIRCETGELPSTGSGITLWSGRKGSSALGERGLPAETVGASAAEEMVAELRTKAAVDRYLADQLVPYLALVGGPTPLQRCQGTPRRTSGLQPGFWTSRSLLWRARS